MKEETKLKIMSYFLAIYAVAFIILSFIDNNLEFLFYSFIMFILTVIVVLYHKHIRLTSSLIIGLILISVLHTFGGHVFIHGTRLYDFYLINGIFIIGMLKGYRPDLFQYLFGDIVAISQNDVWFSLIVTIIAGVAIFITWKQLFKITFNREIAHVSGLNVAFYDYLFIGLLAIVTAVSIKIVGIILAIIGAVLLSIGL